MSIIKRTHAKKAHVSKELRIAMLKNELSLCKIQIRKLEALPFNELSNYEKIKIQRDLEVQNNKLIVIKKNLSELGICEKRGRPKKNDEEKYSITHKKFTAMLSPDNFLYLKQLKNAKKIKNISSFLDELIKTHRNLSQ